MAKLKIYSSKKTTLTNKEKEKCEEIFRKEKEKFERDAKCDGLNTGGGYTRLHDRYSEQHPNN